MDEIFGMPIAGIMVVLLILLSLCLLSVAWVAVRRPVIFKMGVRNLPRRKAQTVLIVVGLMLSTLIISAALGTGDTMDRSLGSEVYDLLGETDEVVVSSQEGDADASAAFSQTFDGAALDQIDALFADDPTVDGIMPILFETVPVIDTTREQAEPSVALAGVDPTRVEDFGGLKTPDGQEIDFAALPENGVVLSESAAEELDAEVGDALTIYYANQPVELIVAAIAEDSILSGVLDFDGVGMSMSLARLQELTGQPNTLSAIAISNTGGVRDSLDHSEAVTETLEAALTGSGLGVHPLKADLVDEAETFAQIFTSIFLVLGLFSIAAGVLLIVLIFTMLAAERRPEMGMARAVGTHRRQLIQQFVAEGSGYAILAGLIGAALGVLAALGLAYGLNILFGGFISIDPYVSPRSLVVAYSLGVVITFLAVVGSSWKISRLNVVAAVRDIPDVANPRRKKSVLVWGGLLLIVGALLVLTGLSGNTAFPFYAGASMAPFGLALLLRFFGMPARPVFSVVGLYLLTLWLMPFDTAENLFGELNGDIEMFFLSGIFMTLGATILIVQNTGLLLGLVSRLGGLFKGKLPAVRTAVAYPGAARGRTGMTIAMFSLIIFSLVMMATMNANFTALYLGDEAAAGWDVSAVAPSANPVGDVTLALADQGVDTSDFTAVGTVTHPAPDAARMQVVGGPDDWTTGNLHGVDAGFLEGSELTFMSRATGYESDAAIVEALRSDPTLAIVDAYTAEGGDEFDDYDGFVAGIDTDEATFAPVQVEIAAPDGTARVVTIIGVLDEQISSLFGLYTAQETVEAIYGDGPMDTSYLFALGDADQAGDVAKEIEAALLTNGVEATSIQDELEESQAESSAFLYIIEGFMGLGLVVGVAAIGVIAFRSVVERRQQIGMLRALGYQRSLVSLSFLIETAFVVGLGVIAGTAMGIVLAYNLFTGEEAANSDFDFLIPWPILTVMILATIVAALLMTWVPARQASRVTPAEALRYE
jgi:putative ABC transport system permease protein